jgi:hypothetical protein
MCSLVPVPVMPAAAAAAAAGLAGLLLLWVILVIWWCPLHVQTPAAAAGNPATCRFAVDAIVDITHTALLPSFRVSLTAAAWSLHCCLLLLLLLFSSSSAVDTSVDIFNACGLLLLLLLLL